MPGRQHPFLTGNIYHVYNKTLRGKLLNEASFLKLEQIFWYYRSSEAMLRLSKFDKLSPQFKEYYTQKIENRSSFRVSVFAYCFMPTHYHVLLRQNSSNGVSHYISQIQNSFTRYFNIKYGTVGPFFLHRSKY